MAAGWRNQYLRYRELLLNIVALYKQKRDLKIFLEILLSLATISIFGIFALKPTLLTISELIKEIQGKEDTLAQMNQKITNINIAENLFSQEPEKISIIKSAIPENPDPQSFVRQIEGVAGKDSINILGISMGETTLVGKQNTKPTNENSPLPQGALGLGFSISVSGNYSNLTSFLTDFQNLRRMVKIDNLGINSSTTEKGQVIIMIISGRTPYLGI